MDINNTNMTFIDSDDDSDDHNTIIKANINMQLSENTNQVLRSFKEFLSEPEFIKNKGDPTTNIVNLYTKKCFNIPDKKIRKLFNYIEVLRRQKIHTMIYEKQQEYSGIMLDLDFKLAKNVSYINNVHYHRLCIHIFKILVKYLHFDENDNTRKEFYVAFTKKPKITFNSEEEYYKDGLHMIIPDIQITREFKRLIINEIIDEEIMEKVFDDVENHPNVDKSEFMDMNSAHVGVFFIGSSSKVNTPPYILDMVYKVKIIVNDSDTVIPTDITNDFLNEEKNINIAYEFSLNFQNNLEKGGVIKKIKYNIKQEYSSKLDIMKSKKNLILEDDEDFENDHYHNELSLLNMHDPDVAYIKSILDVLDVSRSEDYGKWFDVLCALAHTSPSYKALGEYFSMKSPEKFDLNKFNSIWDSILIKKTNKLTMGSIHYWAMLDNKERYNEVRYRSIFSLLYKKIYDNTVEGQMEHYDCAEILYEVLKDKFIYDSTDGCGGSWYEFILKEEPMKQGEMYKWRKYNGNIPNSMLKYISEVLPILYKKCLDKIKVTLDESTEDLQKYHFKIYKNFQKSCKNLKNSGFKRSSLTECEQKFEQIGFNKKLDNNPNLMGVGNGILELGNKCKFIDGYHGHSISKFTEVNYKTFNPYDSMTKKVMISLRNLFPDAEPDTFDFIMHFLASTLDGNPKESILLLLIGKGSNGKSFLMELHKGTIGSIYGVKMPISFLTCKNRDADNATPALMQLKDAHFAYFSESNSHETLNMAKIKELTGHESMYGRYLNREGENFKSNSHLVATSNNRFSVNGNDHGTWRRLKEVIMKIKLCDPSVDKYDSKNPYERLSDPTIGALTENPDALSSYLSILVHYYESLHTNYKGKVINVQHPHIIRETEEFRNSQDKINNFMSANLVKCVDDQEEMCLIMIKDLYIKWYESLYAGANKEYQLSIIDNLESSKIQKYIKKTQRGFLLVGYRVLGRGEEPKDGEEYYTKLHEESINTLNIKSETTMEYYNRKCKEFDKFK